MCSSIAISPHSAKRRGCSIPYPNPNHLASTSPVAVAPGVPIACAACSRNRNTYCSLYARTPMYNPAFHNTTERRNNSMLQHRNYSLDRVHAPLPRRFPLNSALVFSPSPSFATFLDLGSPHLFRRLLEGKDAPTHTRVVKYMRS